MYFFKKYWKYFFAFSYNKKGKSSREYKIIKNLDISTNFKNLSRYKFLVQRRRTYDSLPSTMSWKRHLATVTYLSTVL